MIFDNLGNQIINVEKNNQEGYKYEQLNSGKFKDSGSVDKSLTAEEKALYEKLRLPISELELSVRSSNCLKEANIKTIGDLVRKAEPELLGFRNFGKKSLTEINDLLKAMGLTLGMKIDAKKLRKKE